MEGEEGKEKKYYYIKGLNVEEGEIEEKIKKIMGRIKWGRENRENKKDRGE